LRKYPKQNGMSERKNRHLLKKIGALLFQSNMPKQYWSDAILNVNYLINRIPSTAIDNKVPLEILFQRKINIDRLWIFGCTSFVKIKRKDKVDVNSIKTNFLGYSSKSKGYRCYDPITKKLYISRDVIFIENEPYFQDKNNLETHNNPCTIDQADPILSQLYDLDTLKILDVPNNAHEHESHTQEEEEVSEDANAHEGR
jgi:hypothetical protein